MKSISVEKQDVLQNQNNGSTLYNYDFKQTDKGWECSQVVIWGEVTMRKVKAAVINGEFDSDTEAKLINDYQAWSNDILTDPKYRDNYLLFLSRRRELKEMVDNEILIFIKE